MFKGIRGVRGEEVKLLVCGTRKKGYEKLVHTILDSYYTSTKEDFEIIEGCCEGSADQYAESWVLKLPDVKIHHFPVKSGESPLKRNIDMVEACDEVLAFSDRYSYGTSQCVLNAVLMGKPVKVIDIGRGGL